MNFEKAAAITEQTLPLLDFLESTARRVGYLSPPTKARMLGIQTEVDNAGVSSKTAARAVIATTYAFVAEALAVMDFISLRQILVPIAVIRIAGGPGTGIYKQTLLRLEKEIPSQIAARSVEVV